MSLNGGKGAGKKGTGNRRIFSLKAKESSIFAIICLITLVFFCILACDNGSAPDSSIDKTSGLVKVCLSVNDESGASQKSISVETGWANLTYKYKAVPKWTDANIQGAVYNWTDLSYFDGMSLGYFTPGQWVFYIQILNDGTPVYQGQSEVVNISTSEVDITVSVAKIPSGTPGSIRINITAPIIAANDTLTISWSGTASGSATATPSQSEGITTFTYRNDTFAIGTYTFTLTHNNVDSGAAIAIDLHQGEVIQIHGQLDNGKWQIGSVTMQVHAIAVEKYNWNDTEHPWDYSQTPKYCGSVDIDIDSAVPGDRVSFSANPASGSYVLSSTASWTGGDIHLDYELNHHLYSFIMPDGDVTIRVQFYEVEPVEVNTLLFRTIVQALYIENIGNVHFFGKSEVGPGTGIRSIVLGEVQIWYDSSAHKICWHSNSGAILLSAGSLINLFKDCVSYESISMAGIVTSAITNMAGMFQGCTNLTTLDLTNLNASSATDISNMIQGCTSLSSLTLTGLTTNSTSSVNMAGVFKDCSSLTSLTLPAGFNASMATSLAGMFKDCSSLTSLTLPAGFNASSATSLASMFQGCSGLTGLNLTGFNASSATDISNMFQGCSGLTSLTLTGFTTNSTNNVNMAGVFKDCSKLTSLTLPAGFNTSMATSLAGLFQGCSELTGLNLSGFNANSASDVSNMFYGCVKMTSLNLSGFTINTTSPVNMAGMFRDCVSLTGTLNLSSFDTTQATDMSYMFCGCRGLTSINLSGFHTENVTDMSYMFSSADWAGDDPPAMNLTSLDVSGFRTPKVTNMRQMFYLCYNLTVLDVSEFRTPLVTDMSYMFACFNYGNSKYPGKIVELNLSNWDFTNVTSTGNMFDRQQQLSNLTFPNVTNFKSLTYMSFMFSHCLALTPATFTTIVSKWTFANNPNNVYAQNNDSLFGNTDTDRNKGANYIFRDSMTKTGGKFETRSGYTTADGETLYIGGGNSVRHGRLTVYNPLP